MLVLIVSLSVTCYTKLGKIHDEQIRTCVYVVFLNGEIYTELEIEMAIGRTVKYISYLDDEITKSMTFKEEVFVYVCVHACLRAWKRDNVETQAQIVHLMSTETVVIALNNFAVKLRFNIKNYTVSGHAFSPVEEELM